MWWPKFLKAWSYVKNVSAIRGLLQWIGVWDFCVRWFKRFIGATLVAFATVVWSRFAALPGPVRFVLALASFASTLAAMSCFLYIREAYKRGAKPVEPRMPPNPTP